MAVAVAVTVALSRLKLPSVAGLLAAGALLGPFGLRLVRSAEAIEMLAEVGVVLLLFSIGLEFSFSRLHAIFRRVALGGLLQVGLTTALIAGVALALGQSTASALVYGFVFALSSTAIVLRTLGERAELDAPHGRFIVGTLILQDLCVVPMVLVVPLLGSRQPALATLFGISLALGKAALVIVATVVISRFVVPTILKLVEASRSREVFLLAILALCIGTAWLTSLAGLSLALGTFLAGMAVAGTEYRYRATSDILPLRDAFVSLFFVSLGMLFDVRVLYARPLLVLVLLAGFLLAKCAVATLSALAMGFPARVAWLAGVGLAQFGEFGFVLTRLARERGVVSDAEIGPLLAAGILSMFVTPLLLRAAPHVTAGERLLAPLERLIGVRSIDTVAASEPALSGHVVIVGLGVAGRTAALTLARCDAKFVILELGADNVRRGKELGLPVYYGDATSEEALEHAHLAQARLLVLLMNDRAAAERVLATAKRIAPGVPVLMRTRYLLEQSELLRLGAQQVIVEEVEGAFEVVKRMLDRLSIPRGVLDAHVAEVREETAEREQAAEQLRAAG